MRIDLRNRVSPIAGALALAAVFLSPACPDEPGLSSASGGIRRVLLLSIDGMHAVDFLNCGKGLSTINGGASYCPTLAALSQNGVNYLQASASKLAPPLQTTGNGVAGGTCTPGVPNGTTTEYEEGIDRN